MISIKPFVVGFADQVFDLILPIQREEFGVKISRADQPDLERISEFYQTGNGNFWVAVEDGQVVGSIGLKDIGDGLLALRKMFVNEAWRGKEKGVAQHLLDTAREWASENGCTGIFLGTTAQFLAAHRFYERNGFDEIVKHELPASFPVMAVDTKFYHLKLPHKIGD
jgi:N-acetylglutamate synthase-like GNAT family acetyltransferase